MKLLFPNPSRSYDESQHRIRFWGYDSAIEVTFYIDTAALKLICPNMENVETDFLHAFDSKIVKIHDVAEKMYSARKSRTFDIILSANDFS